MRALDREIIVDTCLFSPLQLQPRALLAQSWNGLAAWFRAHVHSFPRLLGEHRFGMVFLGIQLRYQEPLGFFDADVLEQEVRVRLRRGGSRVELVSRFRGAGRQAAEVTCLLCPVAIGDARSLAATPRPFPEDIQRCFGDDERDDTSPPRTVPGLVEDIETRGEALGASESGFFIHRHHGEVADQWSFSEIPCFCEAAREPMVLAGHDREPRLRPALSRPLRSVDVELSRPYFTFDEGTIQCRAFATGDTLAFVHRLGSRLPGNPTHGVVVERYE